MRPIPKIDLRVLIVDDDALARTSTATLLAAAGFTTGTAENGLVALDMLDGKRQSNPPKKHGNIPL